MGLTDGIATACKKRIQTCQVSANLTGLDDLFRVPRDSSGFIPVIKIIYSN